MQNRRNGYQLPRKVIIFRKLFRPVFRLIFRLISDVRIINAENIPERGAYIIAINHISIIEPPFVIAFWPVAPEAVGAKEIWERKGQSLLAKLYGGIQVRRGEYDRRLFDTMVQVINSGHPLLIAPEGGRSHIPGLRPAQPGVAYLVERSGASVLPVGIFGSTDNFLSQALKLTRPVLEMRIGKLMKLPPVKGRGEERRKVLKDNADLIMVKVAELLPPEYRGVYAEGKANTTETPQ